MAALLLTTLPASAIAAEGAIPKLFHGMWAAGSCAKPGFHLNIEGSGIQGYGADKRSPMGNWDVRAIDERASTVVIDVPETNSGTKYHFEIAPITAKQLRIKMTAGGITQINDFESCSPNTQ